MFTSTIANRKDYIDYACDSVWDNDIANRSIMAEVLNNMFSNHNVYYSF